MEDVLNKAIQSATKSEATFTKFITANDAGVTGAHQSGYHINKNAWPLFFSSPGVKGENKDKFVTINWQDSFSTVSRFIYYGVGTRNEYRLTRFGRNFPFLNENSVGDLLVLSKVSDDFYEAFVLSGDDDINSFLAAINISITQVNSIVERSNKIPADYSIDACFDEFIRSIPETIPQTQLVSQAARDCFNKTSETTTQTIVINPDDILIAWTKAEFELFKKIEERKYKHILTSPFNSLDDLISLANTILNTRKSRAGKSLEHQLSAVFRLNEIAFDNQAITEGNNKPDFLFPGGQEYHNKYFQAEKLLMLAAKTTCKDRWRQILNEADRIKTKHLFTLQQGISANQLNEMVKHHVQLVVPRSNLDFFPKSHRANIITLKTFIATARHIQAS